MSVLETRAKKILRYIAENCTPKRSISAKDPNRKLFSPYWPVVSFTLERYEEGDFDLKNGAPLAVKEACILLEREILTRTKEEAIFQELPSRPEIGVVQHTLTRPDGFSVRVTIHYLPFIQRLRYDIDANFGERYDRSKINDNKD